MIFGKSYFTIIISLILINTALAQPESWAEGKPKHHTENGFRNYPIVPEPPPAGFAFYVRRVWGSFFLPDVPEDHYIGENEAINQYRQFEGQNTVTWLGHATFLIRINGMTILTDPFLTANASPTKYFGPRRFVKPGISLDNLPPVDIVIVSHNHFDHLDAETVESLQNKEKIQVFVPLGLTSFFSERGYQSVKALDWNESASFSGLQFTALPAVHYSRRGSNDKNKTLWCTWSITSPTGKYFFGGDSSYSDTIFKTIGENYGPYDLAIVPIGAYKTRKTGPPTHLTPEEAVKVAMEINSNTVLAMHWGTIELSDEPHWEPPVRFKEAAQKNGFSPDQTWIMKIGETRILPRYSNP